MAEWNDKTSWTITFDMKPTQEMEDFIMQAEKDARDREEAFRKRIEQLFDEYIKIDGEKKDEAYGQILQIFAIGYQHGWNDHYSLSAKKEQYGKD